MSEKPRVLIVDDRPENLYTLAKLLKTLEVEVGQAASGAEALNLTLAYDFCVALVDIQMPEMDGYELVELIRSNKITATLPVIFVSAVYSDEYHHRKGYGAGAVDFLSKPFVPEIMLSKVRVFIDLYQQRKALEEANLALAKLNADKDKFFSTISHDLRDPFNSLLNNAHLILQGIEHLPQTQLLDIGKQTYTSTLTIYSLVETLMTWSTMQRMHLKYPFAEINLSDLAYQAIKDWRDMAVRKNVELINDIEEETYVFADEMMLATIMRNLLANALKYTWSGDRITLSTRPAEMSGHDQDGFIAVSVADTGTGISPEVLTRLFRIDVPHVTPGTANETGAGLGLIMCKEMVGYHGGQLWVESKLGQATTVTFTVPLAAEFAKYM